MNSFSRSTHDFRTKRKWFPMTGCLIFVLLMTQASCRPSETDDALSYSDGDYTDADDIEWQNFPVVETTTKEHPVIYYKEDIVGEDYDPNKENKSSATASDSSSKESGQETDVKPLPRRRYKEILRHNHLNRTERYRYIKPEKVYFDIYPVEDDSSKDDDSKFNEDDIHVEVVSLLENDDSKPTELKRAFTNKRPKKYSRRHRQRRDVTHTNVSPDASEAGQHALRHKRNPYINRHTYYRNQLPNYRGVVVYSREKHPVRGIYINPFSPGAGRLPTNRRTTTTTTSTTPLPDITDRINLDGDEQPHIWGSKPISTKPPRRPPPPIVNSGDEDYVPSENHTPSRDRNPNFGVETAASAVSAAAPPRPSIQRTTTPRPPQSASPTARGVSACIWAISSCCTRSYDIRYQCFERLGCHGAFWDFNPCADDIFQLAVSAADEYLS